MTPPTAPSPASTRPRTPPPPSTACAATTIATVCRARYTDLDSIYRVNPARSDGHSVTAHDTPAPPLTQFGRAMQALGVRLVPAYSPQAKGRVERRHGLFQDRLVKELRLAGIDTREAANRYLEDTFLTDLNARFTVAPQSRTDLHRKLPRGVRLNEVLCWQEERVVARDWTVSWEGRSDQIDKRHAPLSLVGKRITVRRLLAGPRQLLYRDQKRHWRELPAAVPVTVPQPEPKAVTVVREAPPQRGGSVPRADHPWRRRGIAANRTSLRRGARTNGNGKKQLPTIRGHF